MPLSLSNRVRIGGNRRAGLGAAGIVLSGLIDDLDQTPPRIQITVVGVSDGTVTMDLHSSSTPPTPGAGDLDTLTEVFTGGTFTGDVDLSAYAGETFYVHFSVTDGDRVSNILTSQEVTVPWPELISRDTVGWVRGFQSVDGTLGYAPDVFTHTKGAGDGTSPRWVRPVATVIGATYRVEYVAGGTGAFVGLNVSNNSAGTGAFYSTDAPGTYSTTFVATQTTTYVSITLNGTAGQTTTLTGLSLKRV